LALHSWWEAESVYRIKVTSKGQVTLPADLRKRLGLRTGDVLEVRESSEGYLLQKHAPTSPFDRYAGYLSQGKPQSTDQLLAQLRGDE
jgi:AbrB family looped-hinge helix DNA binding protein